MTVYNLIIDSLNDYRYNHSNANSNIDHFTDIRPDNQLKNIPLDFIFAYGPYMCMSQNQFEEECDEIIKYSSNRWMQYMTLAAYLIRKITSGISYKDAKILIRNFIRKVDQYFNTGSIDDEAKKNSLINLGINYLCKLRKEQKEKFDLESFITCASPIVPYSQNVVEKKSHEISEDNLQIDILSSLNIVPRDLIKRLEDLLLNNIAEILLNYNLAVCLYDKDHNLTLLPLDQLILRNENVSLDVQKYYFLALVNFYKLYNKEEFTSYLNFYKNVGNFNQEQDYSVFESHILNMAKSTNINIATETWDDSSLGDKEELAIDNLTKAYQKYENDDEEKSKYDFGKLNDFINVKRYIKFDEYTNRFFISSIENSKIININNMGGNRNYYEMDNHTIACPFLDLRTYQIAVIVLHADTQDIEIIQNISEIY